MEQTVSSTPPAMIKGALKFGAQRLQARAIPLQMCCDFAMQDITPPIPQGQPGHKEDAKKA